MFDSMLNRRKLLTMAALVLLAGCKVIPKGPPEPPPPPPGPSEEVLPTDTTRHRIAVLVPLTGENAAVGQAIANAATMALLDTNAANLRVTSYDTTAGASAAAKRAIADGNKLILGPLLSEHIAAVTAVARPANVPLISFSNDETAGARDVFVMGNLPAQSVTRTVLYAKGRGIASFAALVPRGEYGQRASEALMAAARESGSKVVAMETYDRSNDSIAAAARKLTEQGGYGAVLIADGGRMASIAAPILKPAGSGAGARILGTELWSGEKIVTSSPALNGAYFASVADNRFGQFSESYKRRFGTTPYRIATLGYDAVLLTLRIARDWQFGKRFPADKLVDRAGFLGLDGPFRFSRSGVIERALEVREIRSGGVVSVSPAPVRFED